MAVVYPEDPNDIPVVSGMSVPGAGAGLTQAGTGINLGYLGLGLQGVAGLFGATASYDAAKGEKYAASYQAAIERNRAQIYDYQAAQALRVGQAKADASNFKYAATAGAQNARFAARGIATNEGSAANIMADTDYFKRLDAATIGDNAAQDAWALRMSAETSRNNASLLQYKSDSISPGKAAGGSLLSTAGSVALNWYRMRGGLPV